MRGGIAAALHAFLAPRAEWQVRRGMRVSHRLRRGAGVPARPCSTSFFGGVLRLVRLSIPGRRVNALRRTFHAHGRRRVNAWQRTFYTDRKYKRLATNSEIKRERAVGPYSPPRRGRFNAWRRSLPWRRGPRGASLMAWRISFSKSIRKASRGL